MQDRTHTERSDDHLMPWHLEPSDDGLSKPCILVARMNGNEMLTISLHVADSGHHEQPS